MSEKKVYRTTVEVLTQSQDDKHFWGLLEKCDGVFLRDGPNGERGGLKPWMMKWLLASGAVNKSACIPDELYTRYRLNGPWAAEQEIAAAIRNILGAE